MQKGEDEKCKKEKMKSGANLVEEMNGSGCRPSPTPAGGSLALAAQLILIQSFSYHLSSLFYSDAVYF